MVRVLRRGSVAVHLTEDPLAEGAEVEIEVDWGRRFDHMQQHSGITRSIHLPHTLAGEYCLGGNVTNPTVFNFTCTHIVFLQPNISSQQ